MEIEKEKPTQQVYKLFKLPIEYNEKARKIFPNLKEDLELTKNIDPSKKSIYQHILNPQTNIGEQCIDNWCENYTTDTHFLNDTQKLYKNIHDISINKENIDKMTMVWGKIKEDNNFIEKYNYMGWDKLSWLNQSKFYLTITSFYHITSPVWNLFSPLFAIVFPFILLKLMRVPLNMEMYKKVLTKQFQNHIIGQALFNFTSVPMYKKVYLLFMVWIYFYNIYQNVINCYRFYKNIYLITDNIYTIKEYGETTLKNIDLVLFKIKNLPSYKKFSLELDMYRDKLYKFNKGLDLLELTGSFRKRLFDMGSIMKEYYTIYNNDELNNILNYSLGFNGYIDNLCGLRENINSKKINQCNYGFEVKFSGLYHPAIEGKIIKNDIKLSKNKIITGPNAAGKTTLLKSTIINILFSQQMGFGYYTSGTICPYDYIHCYINIPDTSARDSLFQAEARRCKNILTNIDENAQARHFCIFDELFSGTNPYEAISSGYGYLNYISKKKNINFMLTTHFVKLCKLLDKNKNISNENMETSIIKNKPKYSYKVIPGISKIKGAICVLQDLNYPKSILKKSEKILKSL
ncbi:MAG: hypothetical protein CML42_09825 [Rhodobacteraceae bacterium]|nr:hypothetical protein [Paracoccaceae bacterium]|tara:strand:+ start:9232 stop:10956 length:1725 start_codon:yes stop_codon:yes gene_type:complete